MKMNAVMRLAALCLIVGTPAMAELKRVVSQINAGHEISAGWGSTLTASGAAYMVYDESAGRIVELVLQIDGLDSEVLAQAGPDGAFGAIHIHNYPQGGPDFFIQHLPGAFLATETGFEFHLRDWQVEAPKGRKHDGIDAAFVLAEVARGNAYFGVHSHDLSCPGNKKQGMEASCAAPGTALSGHIAQLPPLTEPLLAAYQR